jgi:hypothetical protein
MVQRYQEVGRKADGLGLHGVSLCQRCHCDINVLAARAWELKQ